MPLKYDDCPLYCLKSKKQLCYLLKIQDKHFFEQEYVSSLIDPYIDLLGKPRLIEPPQDSLKTIQRRIKNFLGEIIVPENVFSGIKRRSYVNNAFFHISGNPRFVYKIDLTAFFPCIGREKVYQFFYKDLCCSPDVAMILTNLTTIDLAKAIIKDSESVFRFLSEKKVKCYNHLISGAPTSQILSYLVNHEMFDEMQALADKQSIVMTIYVDDITFSSTHRISHKFQEQILSIVKKYHYKVSKSKVKNYSKCYPKLITGVIVSAKGKATIKNSLRAKIKRDYDYLKNNPDDLNTRNRLKGLLSAARYVQKDIFPSIYSFAFAKKEKNNQGYDPAQ